jgi:cyclopropane fatty-acyl-phospholipid synthase-like methyltransferase
MTVEAATLPGAFVSAELIASLRDRLKRSMLVELQTGGGMTIEQISGVSMYTGSANHHVLGIRRAVARLRALRAAAPNLAARLLCAGGVPHRVLDVGAGLAPWSLGLASCSDLVHVVALDLPEQMKELRGAVDRAGLGSRFEFVAMDVFRDEIDTLDPFDIVVVANVCHLFGPAAARDLLAIVAKALRPGGRLAVIDQVLDDDPDWVRWAALYAVGIPQWAPGGHLHTESEYEQWIRASGLTHVDVRHLCPPPSLTLMTASR